jgi:hypothetical protein
LLAQAQNHCGYCLSHADLVGGDLEVEHIIPESAGGAAEEANLWMSCARCNRSKGSQVKARDPVTGRMVRLFNPRAQKWTQHFRWSDDGMFIIGKTTCGRATVEALKLNSPKRLTVRRLWKIFGLHPPED